MPSINMRSTAHTVPGQGVGACYEELIGLLTRELADEFDIYENSLKICDIMHYHTVNLRYYFERLTRGRNAVNVAFVHFLPETLSGSLRLNRLYRTAFCSYLIHFYNSMDYLVAVNPGVIEALRSYDLNRPKLVYIPNFVSRRNFYPIRDSADELRGAFGLRRGAFTVLGVGQLQTRKGVFDFAATAEACPEIEFVWAGGFSFGKMSDGYEEIKRLVADHPANLTFAGMIDRSRMNALYNACDMMFLPSFDELFPMTILEALACEKPVLLRDIDVYKEILGGCYLAATDVSGFADAARLLASYASERERMAAISAAASERYGERAALRKWRDFYRSVLRDDMPGTITAMDN